MTTAILTIAFLLGLGQIAMAVLFTIAAIKHMTTSRRDVRKRLAQ